MIPEELAQWVIDNRYPKSEFNKVSDLEMYNFIVDSLSDQVKWAVVYEKNIHNTKEAADKHIPDPEYWPGYKTVKIIEP